MKNLFCTGVLLLLMISGYSQKTDFGITMGLLNGTGRVSENNGSVSSSDSGFYVGLFSKIKVNDKFSVVPEIDYGNLNDNSFGFLSVRANYYIIPKFYFQAGPQIAYIFDVLTDDVKSAGIDLGFGIGYDISENFHLQARYAFETTNRIKETSSDLTARFEWLHVGLGYSF